MWGCLLTLAGRVPTGKGSGKLVFWRGGVLGGRRGERLAAGKRRTEDFLQDDRPNQIIGPAEQGIRRGGRRGGRGQQNAEARRFRSDQPLFLPHKLLPICFHRNRRAARRRLARLCPGLLRKGLLRISLLRERRGRRLRCRRTRHLGRQAGLRTRWNLRLKRVLRLNRSLGRPLRRRRNRTRGGRIGLAQKPAEAPDNQADEKNPRDDIFHRYSFSVWVKIACAFVKFCPANGALSRVQRLVGESVSIGASRFT